MQPARRPFGQAPRQAMVAEGTCDDDDDDDAAGDEEEMIPEAEEEGPASLAEVLQSESEALAEDMLEEESALDPQFLEELETGVEQAAERLLTMREAKSKVSEIKRDRGYGKAGGKGKTTGNQITAKKGRKACWDCGETGHWAGDPHNAQSPGKD